MKEHKEKLDNAIYYKRIEKYMQVDTNLHCVHTLMVRFAIIASKNIHMYRKYIYIYNI